MLNMQIRLRPPRLVGSMVGMMSMTSWQRS
jgi:hypothetical protein